MKLNSSTEAICETKTVIKVLKVKKKYLFIINMLHKTGVHKRNRDAT